MNPLPATAFFFGAGVSTADGIPGTAELTARVRERIDKEGLGPLWDAMALEARGLDLGLNCGFVNYEDVCYLAGQIRDALFGEFDNAAVGAFVHRLCTGLECWLSATPGRMGESWSPGIAREWLRTVCGRLLSDSVEEITTGLWCAVRDKKPPFRAYQALVEAAGDPDLPHIDAFTLNHDRLLETTLAHADVRYRVVMPDAADEGSEPGDGEGDSARVSIYKLHGCVSWEFKYEDDRHVATRRFVRCHCGIDLAPNPAILVGRFNKMLEQANNPAFFDLLRRLAARLAETSILIVSGYSFSDKGINTFLFDWLGWNNMGRRMMVVHAEPERLMAGARPMAGGDQNMPAPFDRGNLQKAADLGDSRFCWIHKWFHETGWAGDLKPKLEGSIG